jgi:hypothetical protein
MMRLVLAPKSMEGIQEKLLQLADENKAKILQKSQKRKMIHTTWR